MRLLGSTTLIMNQGELTLWPLTPLLLPLLGHWQGQG